MALKVVKGEEKEEKEVTEEKCHTILAAHLVASRPHLYSPGTAVTSL